MKVIWYNGEFSILRPGLILIHLILLLNLSGCAPSPPAGAVAIELVRNDNFKVYPLYQFNSSGSLSPGGSRIYFIKIPSGLKTILHARVTGEKKDEVVLIHEDPARKLTPCNSLDEKVVIACGLDLRLPVDGMHIFKVENASSIQRNYVFFVSLKSDKPI